MKTLILGCLAFSLLVLVSACATEHPVTQTTTTEETTTRSVQPVGVSTETTRTVY